MSNQSYLLDTEQSFAKEKGRLTIQAELLFELEKAVLTKCLSSVRATRLLDVGTGNGEYASRVAASFPALEVAGLERNPQLALLAESTPGLSRIFRGDILEKGVLNEVIREMSPDLILFRFVGQHFNSAQRESIFRDIFTARSDQPIVMIDPDDSKLAVSHFEPDFRALANRIVDLQAARGGDRLIGSRYVESHPSLANLPVRVERIEISSKGIGIEPFFEIYGPIWSSSKAQDPVEIYRMKAAVASLEQRCLATPSFEISAPIYFTTINVPL